MRRRLLLIGSAANIAVALLLAAALYTHRQETANQLPLETPVEGEFNRTREAPVDEAPEPEGPSLALSTRVTVEVHNSTVREGG